MNADYKDFKYTDLTDKIIRIFIKSLLKLKHQDV